ncbi:hypothetical protein G9464_14795 [Halostella sp. JP-L12]|uniref:DUF7269 family protein n=1 Tax=Halostella TaxID=1843185 RepID=UPI000EF80898|nr:MULTISPECIES: hypothetical protein [Halostella]NHN48854.1 hypothetical protein [Halostella sp. JP-L12]
MSDRLRAVGAAALVAALAVAFLPAAAPSATPVGPAGSAGLVVESVGALALGAMGLGVLSTGSDGDGSPKSRWYPENRDGTVALSPDAERVGRGIDASVEEFGGGTRRDSYRRYSVTTDLRETAVAVLSARRGYSEVEAIDVVTAGEWTDDARAAALLADEDGPDLPLSIRIRDWARGRAFERRVERAVAEIEALAGRRDESDADRETAPGPVSIAGTPKWGEGDPAPAADADAGDADERGDRA